MMAEGRDRQLWAHTSCVLALLWNVNRDPKRGRPKRPADFNPYLPASPRGIPLNAENIGQLKALLPAEAQQTKAEK